MIQEDYPAWTNEAQMRPGYRTMTGKEIIDGMVASASQLSAARYYVHKLRVHQYAIDVIRGAKSLDHARAYYDEAMRNYDGIISLAPSGHADGANAEAMGKGADAVNEAVEAFKNGR